MGEQDQKKTEAAKGSMLIIDNDLENITKIMNSSMQMFEIEATGEADKVVSKLQQKKFDTVIFNASAANVDIKQIINKIEDSQINVGVIVITDNYDLIHNLGGHGIDFARSAEDASFMQKLQKQYELKKKRENKLPHDKLAFTGDTEKYVSDTYPVYLLGSDFWKPILNEKGIRGEVSKLEFTIMNRYQYRGDSRIIEVKTTVDDPQNEDSESRSKIYSLVTLKNARAIEEGMREAAVYLGCPSSKDKAANECGARTVKYYGHAKNSHGFNLVLQTHETTLEYLITAITANINKPKESRQQKANLFARVIGVSGANIESTEELKKRRAEIIEKAIATIAINNAIRSVDSERIEHAYKFLSDSENEFADYKHEDEKHNSRLETYLKDIMVWKARNKVYNGAENKFDLKTINSMKFKSEIKIEESLLERINSLYRNMLLDKDFYFMNHNDMRLQNLVLDDEIVKDFDLKGCRQNILGWDVMEFLTEHTLELKYDEIDSMYDKFLLTFVNEFIRHANLRLSDGNEDPLILQKITDFRKKFGIDDKNSIFGVNELDKETYTKLKRYSFLQRQILRLRKVDTITETRFMKVEPNAYVTKYIDDKAISGIEIDPTNYLGENWAGIETFYECQLTEMNNEIERMLKDTSMPYRFEGAQLAALEEFNHTFQNFRYVLGGDYFELNLWENKAYMIKDGQKIMLTENSYKVK